MLIYGLIFQIKGSAASLQKTLHGYQYIHIDISHYLAENIMSRKWQTMPALQFSRVLEVDYHYKWTQINTK